MVGLPMRESGFAFHAILRFSPPSAVNDHRSAVAPGLRQRNEGNSNGAVFARITYQLFAIYFSPFPEKSWVDKLTMESPRPFHSFSDRRLRARRDNIDQTFLVSLRIFSRRHEELKKGYNIFPP